MNLRREGGFVRESVADAGESETVISHPGDEIFPVAPVPPSASVNVDHEGRASGIVWEKQIQLQISSLDRGKDDIPVRDRGFFGGHS
jgi:hypothetical protein